MQVKRFVAADMRRALELVRNELGADAIILSSRRVKQGVELLTTVASAEDSELFMSEQTQESPAITPSRALFAESISHKSGQSAQDIADKIAMAARRRDAARVVEASADEYLKADQVVNAGIPQSARATQATRSQTAAERYGIVDAPMTRNTHTATDISDLQEELGQMRLLLEEQLSRLGAAPPRGTERIGCSVQRRLERIGLPSAMARKLVPQGKPLSKAWPVAMAALAHQIPVYANDLTDKGGIFALVGPTGAGKTTTIAKLAARFVLKHGADKVALITADSSRIAGGDALKSIGAILKVPVRVVDANNPLDHVLRSLRRCQLVLIDTAGLRHGDPALKLQMQQLARIRKIQSLLVLSANSQAQMLQASIHAYREANLKGCILTKLDDTQSMGEALAAAIMSQLPIAYTTDGQDVPENIAVPRAHQLVTQALHLIQRQGESHQAL
ncbi:MAG TPA: flagellar biosynthesis protein FlhF [Cellvibrionaceae bacterium]